MALESNAVVNKVVYGDQTLIDLTKDTVTPADLAVGARAHDASGKVIFGEASLLNELNEYEKILYLGAFSDNPMGIMPAPNDIRGSMGGIIPRNNVVITNFGALEIQTLIENNNSIERVLLKRDMGTPQGDLIARLRINPISQHTTFEDGNPILNYITDYEIAHYDETSGNLMEIVTFRRTLTESKPPNNASVTITNTIFDNYQRLDTTP